MNQAERRDLLFSSFQGIEAERRSFDLDEMLEDSAHLGVRDDSQHAHFRPALAAAHWVDVECLRRCSSGP